VYIPTGHPLRPLSSTQNVKNFRIWSLSIFKIVKNQNLNKFIDTSQRDEHAWLITCT